ncbi:PREDICTED: U3 small nucleolar RNA-associated protein 6 homolog isoform X3 [Atta colombica]|uniref:U3 small nucleolar RNA-associated protein 6 homolog isoform X3 n=1 Tax=Atta colombica TaxID=520822 RepID=UPI00084C6901|nr:PREDICTED: U3 small nucleolar RNA-associated protein 6 homolog isoform X3 [Atta colombica]
MAEFVEKRCQDMIPELEQMEKLKLFDKKEIRSIAKKLKEYEYKIQRHTKTKEDYLRYIQYEMDLLKLIKQRRDHFHSNINHMLGRMLQVHRDKPKCWHIAAYWELEENKNKYSARQYLLRGLQIHPNSQLLYTDAFKLELDNRFTTTSTNAENSENQEGHIDPVPTTDDSEIPVPLKTAFFIYQQAFDRIKDVKFIIALLNITNEYDNTKPLQLKIICDMIREYAHEPLMWDTLARRELQGLAQPVSDTATESENADQKSLRARITSCNEVYQTAIKKIKTAEIWSLYIECLLEINRDLRLLPNLKRKLLKTALMQAHRVKKLKEEHYLCWIDILNADKESNKDNEGMRKKLDEVLQGATDVLPNSVGIWHARLNHLLQCDLEKEAYAMFPEVTDKFGEKALPLWKLRFLHAQLKNWDEVEESYQAALKYPLIAKDVKASWLEWLVLTKGIRAARKAYDDLYLQPLTSLEFHKKMISLELIQPEIMSKYVRRPYEMAIMHFGTHDTSIWLDYIKYEMQYGEPKKASDIHERAVKTLDSSLTYSFIRDYGLIMAKPDSIK